MAAAAATVSGSPILRTAIPTRRHACVLHPSAPREGASGINRRCVRNVVTRAAPPSSPAKDKASKPSSSSSPASPRLSSPTPSTSSSSSPSPSKRAPSAPLPPLAPRPPLAPSAPLPQLAPRPPLAFQSIDDDSAEAVVIVGRKWWDWKSWTPRGRGLVLLNILVLLCASNWVVVKQATDAAAPANFTALRFLVAAVAFAPFLPRANRDTAAAGLELGLWSAAGYATQALGLLTTDASRASFLSAFTVVAVPLLSGTRVAGEPKAVEPVTWLCAASAICGVFLLEDAAVDPGPGDAWALASALLFAVQIMRTEARSRETAEEQVLPLLAVTVATVAAVSAAAAAVLACTGEGDSVASAVEASRAWLSRPGEALAGLLPRAPELLWTGLLSTDAVLLIELVALRDVSSIDAAIVYTLEPVVGAFLAWLILGERFGPLGFVGAAVILSSALAAQLVGGSGGGGGEQGEEKKA